MCNSMILSYGGEVTPTILPGNMFAQKHAKSGRQLWIITKVIGEVYTRKRGVARQEKP